jgi:hypothetical protein
MASVIQSAVIVALVLMGLAVIVGMIEPREAVKRIAIFLGLVVFAPVLSVMFVHSLVIPALDVVRAVLKPVLVVSLSLAVLILVSWIVLGIMQRRSGEKS